MPPKSDRRAETVLANAGIAKEPAHGDVGPALHLAATYAWPDPAQKPAFDYARSGNPTRAHLEAALAELEGAAGGVVTASGMGAIALVVGLLPAGARIAAPYDCYGGTFRLFAAEAERGVLALDVYDPADPASLDTALAKAPALVWIETPSNPLMRITDVAAVAAKAKAAGALTCADNTFLSPLLQRPLEQGCDLVVHSTTKYVNGHSDVLGGVALAKDEGVAERLRWWANCRGLSGGAFDAYQTLRGLRTLKVRIEAQSAAAHALAGRLTGRADVAAVHYPGLKDHPGHTLAARQQDGFGAMLSFDLDTTARAFAFLRALDLVTCAASLGGYETLACHPATMTHAGMAEADRLKAGVSDGLIRLSVGLEHIDDLWADIARALEAAAGGANASAPRAETVL